MNHGHSYYGAYNEGRDEIFESDEIFEDNEIINDPGFVAFLEQIGHDLDEWRKKTKIRIINVDRYNRLKDAFISLTKLLQKDNPTATIEYKLNDAFDRGIASITAISYSLDIDDIALFIDAIKDSFGIELMGSNEKDKIRMTISFRSIYDDLLIE